MTKIKFQFDFLLITFTYLILIVPYCLSAQCESIDTSLTTYNQSVERWTNNLYTDLKLAYSNADTVACLAKKRGEWEDAFIVYLYIEKIALDKGYFGFALEVINRMDNEILIELTDEIPKENQLNPISLHELYKANFFYKIRDYETTQKICESAIQKLEQSSLDEESREDRLSDFYNHLGSSLVHQGYYEEAIVFYEKSSKLEEKIYGGNNSNWGRKLIGDYYIKIGKEEEALENYLKVWNVTYPKLQDKNFINEEDKSRKIDRTVQLSGEIANAYRLKRDTNNALKFIDIGLSISDKYDSFRLPYFLYQAGVTYQDFGRFDDAETLLNKTLKIRKGIYNDKNPDVALAYLALGKLFEKKGLKTIEKSINNYHLAILSVVENFNNKDIKSIPSLGQIENSIHKKEIIQAFYYKAIGLEKLATKSTDNNIIHNLQLAHQTLNLSLYTTEKLRTNFYTESDKQYLHEENYKIYEAAIRVSEKLYQLTGDNQYRAHAFEVAEKSKGVILYDAIKNSGALSYSNISDEKLAKERNLKLELAALEKEQQAAQEDESSQQDLANQIFETKQKNKKFVQQLEKENERYYNLKYKPNDITLETIQKELLTKNQTLVEYFLGEQNIYVFVVRSKGFPDLVTIPIKEGDKLNQLIDTFRESIYSNVDEQHQQLLAKQLYQKIFAPIEEKELSNNILIIPDGKLGSIPFDALIHSDNYEQDSNIPYYLGLKYTFSYNYSAALLKEMKGRTVTSTKEGVLGVAPVFPKEGVTIGGNRYGVLPMNDNEVKSITDILGGYSLIGEEATKETFHAESADYPYIHLSTHGVVNNNQPRFSFVSFAQNSEEANQDELLYVSDLFNMNLNAEMVTLSACETGIGKAYRGEGIISLARGFAYAGTKSIFPTLWSVNEQSTVKLMTRFYELLKTGKDKATALRLAKEELILKDKLPPYYWAGTIAIGDMSPIVRDNTFLWSMLILMTMLLIYFFWKKSRKQVLEAL